jgi:hypothetical protein
MIEAGQLRRWRKQGDGGMFATIEDGTLMLVSGLNRAGEVYDAEDGWGKTWTVLQDGATPWFYETEIRDHTEAVE